MNILDKIIADIRVDLVTEKEIFPEKATIAQAEKEIKCRDFKAAFARPSNVRIIAELKKASPSKGLIRPDFEPEKLCVELEAAGAAALSVLTEKNYFLGSQEYLQKVSKLVNIPVLRKDFIVEPYQIYRARVLGADAILLIAAALDQKTFASLYKLAYSLGMAVLCEIHNRQELDMVLEVGVDIIGINCRDLKTFKTDIAITKQMLEIIPKNKIVIAESGITCRDDIMDLIEVGASGFLIGETLMRAEKPGDKLSALIRGTAK